jgi:RecQ-mediated genome instability protein 1
MSFVAEDYLDKKEAFTPCAITFNILGIIDITNSKLSQIDKWRDFADPHKASVDRLNKGRHHVIRELAEDGTPSFHDSSCFYKLLLRDQDGHCCYGYEFDEKLRFLHPAAPLNSPLPIALGGRLTVHKGTLVAHGVLMLANAQCTYLGPQDEDAELCASLNLDLAQKHIQYFEHQLQQPQ